MRFDVLFANDRIGPLLKMVLLSCIPGCVFPPL